MTKPASQIRICIGLGASHLSLLMSQNPLNTHYLLINSNAGIADHFQQQISQSSLFDSFANACHLLTDLRDTRICHSYNDRRLDGEVGIERWSSIFPNAKLLNSQNREYITLADALHEWDAWAELFPSGECCTTDAELTICEGDPYPILLGASEVLPKLGNIAIDGPCARIADVDLISQYLYRFGFILNDDSSLGWKRDLRLTELIGERLRSKELESTNSKLNKDISLLRENYSVLEALNTQLEKSVAESSQVNQKLLVAHDALCAEAKSLSEKLSESQVIHSDLREDRDRVQSQLSVFQSNYQLIHNERDMLLDSMRQLYVSSLDLDEGSQTDDEMSTILADDIVVGQLTQEHLSLLVSKLSRASEQAKEQIVSLSEQINRLNSELHVVRSSNESLLHDNHEISILMQKANSDAQQASETIVCLSNENNTRQSQIMHLQGELDASKQVSANLLSERESLVVLQRKVISNRDLAFASRDQTASELRNAEAKYSELVHELDQRNLTIEEQKQESLSLKTETSRLHDIISSLRDEKQESNLRRNELTSLCSDLKDHVSELTNINELLTSQVNDLNLQLEERCSSNTRLGELLSVEADKVVLLMNSAVEADNRLSSANVKYDDLDLRYRQLDSDYAAIQESLSRIFADTDIFRDHGDVPGLLMAEAIASLLTSAELERDRLEGELNSVKSSLVSTSEQLHQRESTIAKQAEASSGLKEEIRRLHGIITDLRKQLEALVSERSKLALQNKEYVSATKKLSGEVTNLQCLNQNLKNEITEVRILLSGERETSETLGALATEFQAMTQASSTHLSYIQQLLTYVIKDQVCALPSLSGDVAT